MTLEQEIDEASTYYTDPPKNESSTCEWIILPILWATGYARREVVSRAVDSTGQFPDYTLLPDHPTATWYLEAKAWNVALEAGHARQALNYANQNGRRFVVLTNGQEWRLYDNSIQGELPSKLLYAVELRDTDAVLRFLQALSKEQVLSGSLDDFAEQERLRRIKAEAAAEERRHQERLFVNLSAQMPIWLADTSGELIEDIGRYVRRQAGFHQIQLDTIARYFSAAKGQSLAVKPSLPTHDVTIVPLQQPPLSIAAGTTLTLPALQARPVDGKTTAPLAVYFPDNSHSAVTSWVTLAEQIVRWMLRQHKNLPVPYGFGTRSRWFLSLTPQHKNTAIRAKFREISENGRIIYMDKDRSGDNFLAALHDLCRILGIAPQDIRIVLR